MISILSIKFFVSRLFLSLVITSCFGLFACQEKSSSQQDHSHQRYVDSTPVLASVGQVKITQAELERRLAELSPVSRARYQNPERRQELMETLIRFELLAGEALKQGHGENPEVKLAYKQAMVRELLKKEVRDLVKIGDISEQSINHYYQEHLNKYQNPELVRVSHILFKTQVEAEARLKEISLHITAKPKQARKVFGDFATQYSLDQETKARRGDLQYFDREGNLVGERLFPQSTPPKAVSKAAFGLVRVGEISAQAIQSEKGWHILMRTGGKRAFKRELKDVQTEIRNALFRVRKAKALENYVEQLKSKATVKVNQSALEALKIKARNKRQRLEPGLSGKLKVPLDLKQTLSP